MNNFFELFLQVDFQVDYKCNTLNPLKINSLVNFPLSRHFGGAQRETEEPVAVFDPRRDSGIPTAELRQNPADPFTFSRLPDKRRNNGGGYFSPRLDGLSKVE